MITQGPGRVNGTYHAAEAHKERTRRIRVVIVIGGLLALVGAINVLLVNADMSRIEREGPERLALAGVGSTISYPASCPTCSVRNNRPTR